MAAAPSIESFDLNFHRTTSLPGREEPATPVCKGLPRNMGQSALVFAAGSVFLISPANRSTQVSSRLVRLMTPTPEEHRSLPLHLTPPLRRAEANRLASTAVD